MIGLGLWAAGWEEAIGVVVVIVFILISFLGQLLGKLREGRRAQPKGPRGPQAQGPGRPGGRDALRDELDEFLRGAKARRPANQPQAARQPAPRPAAPRPPERRRPTQDVVAVEVIEEPRDAGVADHVRRRMADEQLRQAHPAVGGGIARAERQADSRLHQLFDHGIGSLVGAAGESGGPVQPIEAGSLEYGIAPVPITVAAGLAAMLAHPGNLRQAIVLSEILQRPEQRWE
jgi:hypothetical protein